MTTQEQKEYLLNQLVNDLRSLSQPANANWGKMNFNQMLEHLIESCKNASGDIVFETFHSPEERLPAMQAFLMTDKLFKPDTKNSMMGEEPEPVKNDNTYDLLDELQSQLNRLATRIENQPDLLVRNPIFGDLNEELWTRLLYKHCIHHLHQFQLAI
jgi:oxepin-CoA hydrolase/3-oxo-5,6-dehydrosuberyl-CoA semialdehyde dehydrogenase